MSNERSIRRHLFLRPDGNEALDFCADRNRRSVSMEVADMAILRAAQIRARGGDGHPDVIPERPKAAGEPV